MAKFDSNGFIIELEKNEIFVFGSNLLGNHTAGAAKQAMERFGAIKDIGSGLKGDSYAIPTMDGYKRMLDYSVQFIDFARHYPEYIFYLTAIGQGIAGYSKNEVEPIFNATALPENIIKVGWGL